MSSIVFKNVNKLFGSRQVLHNLSFCVEPDEIVGLLGPNGSGKTTTLRLMAGYYKADSGLIQMPGIEGAGSANYVGYLPERAPLYDSLSVNQYLEFVGRCKGLVDTPLKLAVEQSLNAFNLVSVSRTAIGRLSKGFRQRVGLGQAVLGQPGVLLLDEATNGLDPIQIIEAREMIRQAARGKAVVFSSHLMQEVQALCTRAIILRHGRLIADVNLTPSAQNDATMARMIWRGQDIDTLVTELLAAPLVKAVTHHPDSHAANTHQIEISFTGDPTTLNPIISIALQYGDVQHTGFEQQDVEQILVKAIREADQKMWALEATT